jgi:hypothetical protein
VEDEMVGFGLSGFAEGGTAAGHLPFSPAARDILIGGDERMKPIWRVVVLSAMAVSLAVVAAVSWHSVEEIHYLKTFYPKQFTVQEAFYAAGVELIKVFLIGLPLFIVIGAGLYALCRFRKDRE